MQIAPKETARKPVDLKTAAVDALFKCAVRTRVFFFFFEDFVCQSNTNQCKYGQFNFIESSIELYVLVVYLYVSGSISFDG